MLICMLLLLFSYLMVFILSIVLLTKCSKTKNKILRSLFFILQVAVIIVSYNFYKNVEIFPVDGLMSGIGYAIFNLINMGALIANIGLSIIVFLGKIIMWLLDKKYDRKKYLPIIVGILILVILGIYYLLDIKYDKNNDIIKYEVKTSECFDNTLNANKYLIDTESELNKFYDIYSDKLAIDKNYLKDNSIFIQVEQVGSDSVQKKLSSVKFNNNTVRFIIKTKSPKIGTMDMAFWYFVAIIPNNKLNDLNLSDWTKPSDVLSDTKDNSSDVNNYVFELNNKNKYTIITDTKLITVQNDGGSHTSIYYQVDLENNIIRKIQEDYKANLGGLPKRKQKLIYMKNINNKIKDDASLLIDEIKTKEDSNETHNYKFYTILTLNSEKKIYNKDMIKNIKDFLQEIDDMN